MSKSFAEKDVGKIARLILNLIAKQKNKKAFVVALSGELGAGKTTLTREIARQLGISENVNSPTYVIMKSYKIPHSTFHFRLLIHIDAYRLESEQELLKLRWEEIVNNKENLVLIEWPERVKKLIPKDGIKVSLKHVGKRRSISIK